MLNRQLRVFPLARFAPDIHSELERIVAKLLKKPPDNPTVGASRPVRS